MRKKDKLYTVNKWNQPAFMPQGNIYWPGGSFNLSPQQMQQLKLQNMSTNPGGGFPSLGVNMAPQLTTSSLGLGSLGKGGMGSLSAANPTEFFGLGSGAGAAKGKGLLSGINVGGLATSLAPAVGNIAGGLIGGGMQSEAGAAISNIGGTIS